MYKIIYDILNIISLSNNVSIYTSTYIYIDRYISDWCYIRINIDFILDHFTVLRKIQISVFVAILHTQTDTRTYTRMCVCMYECTYIL